MNAFTIYSDPGYTALVESGEWDGLWNAFNNEKHLLTQRVTVDSTAVDSGNTPTTTLRAGTIMAKKDSDGNYYPYDPDATDGTQNARGVLGFQLPMTGPTGTVQDKGIPLIVRANMQVAELHNYDAQAGRQLTQLGFILDAPAGANSLPIPGMTVYGDGGTVTAAQNGSLFQAAGAAAFTLPTIAVGLAYEFYQTADADMSIASAGSLDNIVADGDATADSVAFSTSSHKIGSHARFVARYNAAGALRWYFSNLGGTAATVT